MVSSNLRTLFTSNSNLDKKSFYLISISVGVLFIVTNILTITFYPLAWVDEVMFTEPALNYYQTGVLFDFTWQYGPVYPPLYFFILASWMKVFGFGMLEVRSLNIILGFFNSILFFRLLLKLQFLKSSKTLFFALLMFWCSNLLSWMMRNGRVDMLTMSVFLILTFAFVNYIEHRKLSFTIFASIIAPLAGLQILPLIVFSLFFAMLFFPKSRRRIFEFTLITGFGIAIGIALMLLFFKSIGHLDSFLANTFAYSDSLKVFLGDLVINSSKSLKVNTEVRSFKDKIIEAYLRNKEILFLLALCLAYLIYLLKSKKIGYKSFEIKHLLYILMIPLIMTLAGRLMYYYTWMGYLAVLSLVIYLVDNYSTKWFWGIFFVSFLSITISYPYNFKRFNLREVNKDIASLIHRQDIQPNDSVLATLSVFYNIREKTNHVYFYTFSLFNPEKPIIKQKPNRVNPNILNGLDYVIYAADDRGAKIILQKVELLKEMGKKVSVVDSLPRYNIKVFKVE